MNVWIKKCRKRAKCNHCPKEITKGSYMVVCRYYKKTKNKSGVEQRWKFELRFHPQCWIDQGIASLEAKPFVETRGRKRAEMTDDVRAARLKVMRRRASVTQRIKREVSKAIEGQSVDKVIHLGSLLNKLKEEIEPLGGIPPSWE